MLLFIFKAVILLKISFLIVHSEKKLKLLLRVSLCKILISSFAHEMDFAHNFSVDFLLISI